MTYKEALNFDQKWTAAQARNDLERYLLRDEKPAYKAVALGMQALEKQIPKKPLPYKGYEGQCPECGVVYLDRLTGYCGNCGQKLFWETENG